MAIIFDVTNGDNLMLNRGDTLSFALFINAGDELNPEQYIVTENDTVYFALMEANGDFEHALLKKVFTSESEKDEYGNIIITLVPEDTQNLICGEYSYTIKLKSDTVGGKYNVFTLISQRRVDIIN